MRKRSPTRSKRYSVFYQPTGDGRITALHRRMHAAPFGERQPVNALAHQASPEAAASRGCRRPTSLTARCVTRSPAEIIAAALRTVGRERLAVVSSFGTESAALLKVMADVDPAIPVVFLDTGWLFEETLAYRDTLIAQLGLRDVRSIKPLEETLSREDPDRELWFSDPDACCRIRKVEPLDARAGAVQRLDQRPQAVSGRACAPTSRSSRQDGGRLKFNPFANVSREEIDGIYASPTCRRIRLRPCGYLSVGCMPCTSRTSPDEDRARRPLARPSQDRMRHPHGRRLPSITPLSTARTTKCGFVDLKPLRPEFRSPDSMTMTVVRPSGD